jgi:hypothetical protein
LNLGFLLGVQVIADSWFGSPAIVRSLRTVGLFSIMQVKKKRYRSRGIPAEDIIQSFGEDLGSVTVMKARADRTFSLLQCVTRNPSASLKMRALPRPEIQ